ncbi:MAG: hypothetical protein F6J93_08490 [Oscillatoria sp. SIO1A7]|nr:hypothetical protein [Oscillatoria sp. SIO1A7]
MIREVIGNEARSRSGCREQKFFADLEIKNEKSYTVASSDLLAVKRGDR